jgi:hypothetical protein
MKKTNETHTGIVLSGNPEQSSKVSLLDSKLGRLEGYLFSQRRLVGALLDYTIQMRNGLHWIVNYEIVDMPLSLARVDLLFLHHVLELCCHFMPNGTHDEGVFELLMILYKQDSQKYSPLYKKVFLFKILTMVGLYPEHTILRKPSVYRLINMSIDKIMTESIDLECEKDLGQWIAMCIADHPRIEHFKSIDCLK